jgi:hypothetical protein
LKEDKTYREIQRLAHVGPEFIVKVKKEVFGPNYIFENQRTKNSKNTHAIRLFGDGKKRMEIALDLDMESTEVNNVFIDYLRLKNLDRFAELLCLENTEKLDILLMIINIFHTKGISEKHEFLNILKHIKELETLQKEIKNAIDLKINLIYETIKLKAKENNLKKNIKSSILRNQYFYQNQRRKKTDIDEKEERPEQLHKLIQDIYNLEVSKIRTDSNR